MMGLGCCFSLTKTSLELFYTQMRRDRNSFWHSLFDGGGVPTDYIMVNRPDMISMLDVLFITIALMVGTAGLPHVIVRFYTVPDVRAARFSAGWALLFIALLYTSAPALATFARYNLINTLHDRPIEQVRQLDWANKWEKTKLLTFDDKNNDGRVELTADKATRS